jgi:hypothetical protein
MSKNKSTNLAAGRLSRDAGGHDDSHGTHPGSTYGTNRLGLQVEPEIEELPAETPPVVPAVSSAPSPSVSPPPAPPAGPFADELRLAVSPVRWEPPAVAPPLEPVKVPTPLPSSSHPWMEHTPKPPQRGASSDPGPLSASSSVRSSTPPAPIRSTAVLAAVAAGLFLMLLVWGISGLFGTDTVEAQDEGTLLIASAAPSVHAQAPDGASQETRSATASPNEKPRSPEGDPAPVHERTDRAMAWLADQTRDLTESTEAQTSDALSPPASRGADRAPVATVSPDPAPAGYGMVPEWIHLRGIIHQPGASYADINGRFVQEGQTVDGAKVLRISRFFVEMEAEGKRFQLRFGQQAREPENEDSEFDDEYSDDEGGPDEEAEDEDDSRRRTSRRPKRR